MKKTANSRTLIKKSTNKPAAKSTAKKTQRLTEDVIDGLQIGVTLVAFARHAKPKDVRIVKKMYETLCATTNNSPIGAGSFHFAFASLLLSHSAIDWHLMQSTA